MKFEGNILKMQTEINSPIDYFLPIGENNIPMNSLIGKEINLLFKNQINCVKCGRKTKTSFGQGYCYPCFQTVPETAPCIIRPELCEAHLGNWRDKEFAENTCLKDHVVYLALTSAVKVGVTRATQVPTRWIDQGAWKVIKLARTPNRNFAGKIEVALKAHLTDKTNWRKMLTNVLATDVDLVEEKQKIKNVLPEQFLQYYIDDDEIVELQYPVLKYPEKVKSLGFDKQPEISGILTGIKGQYLILEGGFVVNIRKHTGYFIEFRY